MNFLIKPNITLKEYCEKNPLNKKEKNLNKNQINNYHSMSFKIKICYNYLIKSCQ